MFDSAVTAVMDSTVNLGVKIINSTNIQPVNYMTQLIVTPDHAQDFTTPCATITQHYKNDNTTQRKKKRERKSSCLVKFTTRLNPAV